jgi:hypothetical protein
MRRQSEGAALEQLLPLLMTPPRGTAHGLRLRAQWHVYSTLMVRAFSFGITV